MLLYRAIVETDADGVAALIRRGFATQSVVTDPPPSARLVAGAAIRAQLAPDLIPGGGGAIAVDDGVLAGAVLWEEKAGGLYQGRAATG